MKLNHLSGLFIIGLFVFGLLGSIHTQTVGKETEFFVNVKNPTQNKLYDLGVRIFYLGSEGYTASLPFNIRSGDKHSVRLGHDQPSDEFLVKVVVSNDDEHSSKYVYLDTI